MTANRMAHRLSRITAGVMVLFLAAGGLAALAGSAKRTRPSGSGSAGGSTKASAASAGSSRRGSGTAGSTTAVSGRASYGYGNRGYRYGGYSYYPGGWYGGYGWYGPYGYGWYGPYGYGWYGPYAGHRYRMVTVAVSPDRNAPAVLETDVHPRKAHLILNGDDMGKVKYFNGNWDRLPLPPGQHTIEFRAKGYRTLKLEMETEAGRFYRLDYRMEKGEGEDPRSMRLPRSAPREETIEKAERTASPGLEAGVSPGLLRGLLRIRVSPADAAVYLDGEFLGRGDELSRLHGALPVAAGFHRIEVVRPGFTSRTQEVEVIEGGDPVRIELELDRE